MNAIRLGAAALLLCLAALRAAAQDADRLQRAHSALPAGAAMRLDRILQSAAAHGIPTSPLVDKTLEGEAKRVPPDRILDVVAALAGNLERARDILLEGGAADADEVTAAADALRRGVPEASLRALRLRQHGRPFTLPVETLADLMQQGVPGDQAVALLATWSQRGGEPGELRELPAAVERLIRNGTLPAQAATTVAHAIWHERRQSGANDARSDDGRARFDDDDRPPLAPGAGPPPGKHRRGSRRGGN